MRSRWWVGLHVGGALLVPFVLLTAYLARVGTGAFDKPQDALAFCLTVLAGLMCLLRVLNGIEGWKKVVAGLFYVPAMTVALSIYGVLYVCSAYNACM